MKQYVKSNMCHNEVIIKEVNLSAAPLVGKWILGILFFWVAFLPLIHAIVATILHGNIELAFTNKRIIGKTGAAKVNTLEAPLSRIQNISVNQGFWARVFGYGTIRIDTAAGKFIFAYVKDPYTFKQALFEQLERTEYEQMRLLAYEIANATAYKLKEATKTEAPAQAPQTAAAPTAEAAE